MSNMASIVVMLSFVKNVLLYAISRVHMILLLVLLFASFRLLRILSQYNRMRRLTNLIPGINCQNLFLGNLQIISSGVNQEAGVDAYQGMFVFIMIL